MASGTNPDNRSSYLPAGLGGLSPWGSRTASPKPPPNAGTAGDGGRGKQQGGDHTINPRNRVSPRKYPPDCPPLNVQWFYAVDVPKRKPLPLAQPSADAKPPPAPKKFVPFSIRDSRAVEKAFQKYADDEDAHAQGRNDESAGRNTAIDDSSGHERRGKVTVPVNEDFLFDVDIERRELAPVYWLGPIYDVRRATWCYQEGSTLRPCDENLATQLEEGYVKVKPFRYAAQPQRSASQTRSRPTSLKPGEDPKSTSKLGSRPASPKPADDAKTVSGTRAEVEARPQSQILDAGGPVAGDEAARPQADSAQQQQPPQPQTHRLFGAHLNSVVTYQDATTAWILTDDFMSRMSSNVYQRFAGGGYLGGIKVVRGYTEPGKAKEPNNDGDKKQEASTADADDPDGASDRPPADVAERNELGPSSASAIPSPESEARRRALERTMSSMVASTEVDSPEKQEEEARRRDEKEIQDDYRGEESEDQDREIEHVILVTHGIGQRLGLRMESVNFIHDVNVLRKTLKAVYASSADLQALNSEVERLPKNCRVQVLPVCWRHLLDFPKQRKRQRKEHDLGEVQPTFDEEEEDYPSLDDITVEGVPAVRNLITDLALDILLYQSSYRDHISGIVLRECNRIHKLFLERNPDFNGQVSLVGHSLGSAILFDILCDQRPTRERPGGASATKDENRDLDFEVANFFCLGSPVGLFQMLRGRTIAGRSTLRSMPAGGSSDADSKEDPFLGASSKRPTASRKGKHTTTSDVTHLPLNVSSPKCSQLFNLFHPTDPISYRIEPLITPAMASLKPQPLPYTKKGIFGAQVGQGLTGIGVRVGQSVTGLWTSFSSGIANSILNRSLGLTAEESKNLGGGAVKVGAPLSVGAGTNVSGGVIAAVSASGEQSGDDGKKRKTARDTMDAGRAGQDPPALIDSEMETLFAGFEKRRKSQQSDGARDLGESPEWKEVEQRGRRLRQEEAKVRALNSNGRVDFSIQEGVFDISLIASIASHLSYWGDEDISHFIISQLLSRHGALSREKADTDRLARAIDGV
ncbi:MAG: hypothetical protein M1832_004430 [Thelocarpon impressellum]|nr:MAG: hypothetical protein M1832_004430 [Thelocarpon impressellum]